MIWLVNISEIRLVDVANSGTVGRLEIFHVGRWGSVCDDDFDESDAQVRSAFLNF